MNCVNMKCIHCKARDIPCDIHITKDVVCHSIMDIYCDIGGVVHVPFNDDGERFYCSKYERRDTV